jgi:hypothetical protein
VSSRLLAVAESAAAGVCWAALVAGLGAAILTAPVLTSASVQALGVPATAGLSRQDTVALSGMVRAFVTGDGTDPLPAQWRGEPAFDAQAVSHLDDVRRVFTGARLATGAAAAILALWVGIGVARRRWRPLIAGMRAGAGIIIGVAGLAVLVAAVDFDGFFAAFHGLFFKSGTWVFPYDSMIIRLFPERFWITMGAAWGALAVLGSATLLVVAYVVRVRVDSPA